MKEKYTVDTDQYHLSSISFDRGFYSGAAKKELDNHFDEVVMPKSGKKNLAHLQEEAQAEFRALKKAHSMVEANINCLEHHGVGRCADRGINGFKRYIAFGVLSYNLHQLGKLLRAQQKAIEIKEIKKEKAKSKALKRA